MVNDPINACHGLGHGHIIYHFREISWHISFPGIMSRWRQENAASVFISITTKANNKVVLFFDVLSEDK